MKTALSNRERCTNFSMKKTVKQAAPRKMAPTPPNLPIEPEHHSVLGPIVGVVVIVIIIALGGYYIWDTKIRNGGTIVPETGEMTPKEDAVLAELRDQSESDTLSATNNRLITRRIKIPLPIKTNLPNTPQNLHVFHLHGETREILHI